MSKYSEEASRFNAKIANHIISSSYLQLLVESLVLGAIIYAALARRFPKRKHSKLTEAQKERIISEWKPAPLVQDVPEDHCDLQINYFDGRVQKFVKIDGKEYMNFATTDFLGLIGEPAVEAVAKQAIAKYGVGSCGPRGFYGTVDVHLNLEKELAAFLGCEEAVLYSYGFATVASAIPSYAKKGDVIFADNGVNFAVQKGLEASKSCIEWFEHNDMADLERLLIKQADRDKLDTELASKTRRFLVVEGLYANSGDLCPLPKLIAFKWRYKVRIFIDESLSIGVLGKSGKGVTEYYGIDVVNIDMIMGSLEHSLASTGGFCAGRTFVVNHQRLSGLGYCFSASLPPLLTVAASKGLEIIAEEPERLRRLQTNCQFIHEQLRSALQNTAFSVRGCEQSPLHHIHAPDSALLDQLIEKMKERSFLMVRARYLELEEAFTPTPSIRFTVQSEITQAELSTFIESLREEAAKISETI